MAYFKKVAEEEYAKGNYVIVGGDWNQCPPNFYYTQLMPNNPDSAGYKTFSIAPDFMAKDWQWVYDPKVATNRKLVDTFVVDKTFTTLIDFYLVSPNVEVLEVRTQDLKFAYSDHQPVFARFRLKGLKPQIELGDSLSVNSQDVKK
jgi:endonuclease/exonuclease/phosphatase family metal-dependent hydrolase